MSRGISQVDGVGAREIESVMCLECLHRTLRFKLAASSRGLPRTIGRKWYIPGMEEDLW